MGPILYVSACTTFPCVFLGFFPLSVSWPLGFMHSPVFSYRHTPPLTPRHIRLTIRLINRKIELCKFSFSTNFFPVVCLHVPWWENLSYSSSLNKLFPNISLLFKPTCFIATTVVFHPSFHATLFIMSQYSTDSY